MKWVPPGPGVWWFTREHFPVPVSGLFTVLFPPTVIGWQRAAAHYGWPIQSTTFAAVNGWLYYSPGTTDWDATLSMEAVAERTLARKTWREEVARWRDVERPSVLTKNLVLQDENLAALGDVGLADHIDRAIGHFREVAPLHFEHAGFDIAAGLLFQATSAWGIDAADVAALLAGASPATAAVTAQIDEIARHLDAVPETLDEVRNAGEEVANRLDGFLVQHGWRVIDGNDLAGPTLGERPNLVLAAIRSRVPAPSGVVESDPSTVRDRVPADERSRFDELLADARDLYALRDDDNGLCFVWPLGLIRRGALEAGRRLVASGALHDGDDLFEATPDEIDALLTGGDAPDADDLGTRRETRLAARDADPPAQLGDLEPERSVDLPPHVAELDAIRNAYFAACGNRSRGAMHGLGIGRDAVRGPARVLSDDGAVDRIEPGDVLIAITTTCTLNAVFPLLAGVATEEGGLFSHTALLSRELGIPAVVGAPGLLASIADGDIVEVDPTAGAVRVIERA